MSSRRLALSLLVGFLACWLATPAQSVASAPRPVVLLFSAGGFVLDDSSEMPEAAAAVEAAGLQPRFIDYPRFDLLGAVHSAERAARRAGRNGRAVYAYGDSAGGTLAALLAERGLVRAAATFCPVANLRRFANHASDPDFYVGLIQANRRLLLLESPGLHDSDRPIFAMRPVADEPYLNQATAKWDARDPQVKSVSVAGGHMGAGPDPSDPVFYGPNMTRGIGWLARQAGTKP